MNFFRSIKLLNPKHYFVFITLISLVVLSPSFRLHFDGDSYLNLWLYKYYIVEGNWNMFTYFFTDYGPQAVFFTLIYKSVGLTPFYFYLISYLLRLLASFSFYPLVFYITRNKYASAASALFFSITTTGLEATNWVFNMPSYPAVIIFNLFLLSFLIASKKLNFKFLLLSGLLFALCIIIQPIRMTFLPILALSLPLVFFADRERRKPTIILTAIYLLIFIFLFVFGNLGSSIVVASSPMDKLTGTVFSQINNNMNGLLGVIKDKQFSYFLYPIAQLGYIILPYKHLGLYGDIASKSTTLLKLFLPEIILFFFILKHSFREKTVPLNRFVIIGLLGIFWSFTIWYLFYYNTPNPFQISQLISFLIGGHFLLFLVYYLLGLKFTLPVLCIILSLAITFLGFSIPWVRFPRSLIESANRYLVIPAAGFSLMIGLLFSLNKRLINSIKILFIIVIIHVFASYNYLNELSNLRGYQKTEKIRNSIPIIESFHKKGETPMVYLESDDEKVLYHSLLFGFPSILYFHQGAGNIWNIAYTQNWSELLGAYQTGEALKRFGTMPIEPVKLDNIYSLKIEGDTVIDTTFSTRERLKSSDKQ